MVDESIATFPIVVLDERARPGGLRRRWRFSRPDHGSIRPGRDGRRKRPGRREPGGRCTGSITVTSLWGGSEQESFQKVLDAFNASGGCTANYESIRTDYATVLQTRITGGNPPDVSILPGIGFLRRFARDGSIKKIAELGIDPAALEAGYAPGVLDIGKVDDELYAIMVKFNSKSTLWYRPDRFTEAGVTAPKTWDEFKATLKTIADKGTKPLGLGTGPDTWTLTDWFESIYLRQAGAEKYDQLFAGTLPWTDPSVQTAVDTMKEVAQRRLRRRWHHGRQRPCLGRRHRPGVR